MRKQLIAYPRRSGKKPTKHPRYYIGVWNEVKGRYDRFATPCTSEAAALKWAAEQQRTGALAKSRDVLADYLVGFWDDDGQYATDEAARGRKHSRSYLYNNRLNINNHVLPWLEATGRTAITIDRVTPAILKDMIRHVSEKGLASRTVNAVYQSVSVALGVYWSDAGHNDRNPSRSVGKLAEERPVRDIMSVDEARRFFTIDSDDSRIKAVNMLAASTGLRVGECIGLRIEDIQGDEIQVRNNWQAGEGLKAPKAGSYRRVPVPDRVAELLRTIAAANPWNNGFVFWGARRDQPMSKRFVDAAFAQACERIGISPEERKRRRLTFHAWRHWFNSMMRGRVDDHVLRQLTRHRSEAMTEHYTEVTDEQRRAVGEIADGLF